MILRKSVPVRRDSYWLRLRRKEVREVRAKSSDRLALIRARLLFVCPRIALSTKSVPIKLKFMT